MLALAITFAGLIAAQPSATPAAAEATVISPSSGQYRLPYADGTRLSVFDDDRSHRPIGALDLVGEPREGQMHRIVAAADGTVMAIEDGYHEQLSGRAASECRNNYVWLAHANGEWTLYSHMRQGTTRRDAGLGVGDQVTAGQYLGDEGAVGCAMLSHLHFEVAVPADGQRPVNARGFLTDNAERHRMRVPHFCGIPGGRVVKNRHYTASPCLDRSPGQTAHRTPR